MENQTAINIHIYQGERELVSDCRLLGKFKLGGIPPMPAQLPQVDVTFLVDANGMLTVRAKEQRSGQEASVTVQPAHGLTTEEVDRLVQESIEHAQTDFTQRRFIELKNKADADLRHTDKALAQAGQYLTGEQKQAIESARLDLQSAMSGHEVDRLQKSLSAFNQVTNPLAEVLMNTVVQATLGGKAEAKLDASKL